MSSTLDASRGRGSRLVLSCEHASARIPAAYARLFESREARRALETHRGHDIGALAVARVLSTELRAPLIAAETSRLLVDLNRSVGHPRLFSQFSAELDPAERVTVLERHYFPHRRAVESEVQKRLRRGVFHVAVHSFTPVLDGDERTADIGLLYDPASERERRWCAAWQAALAELAPELRVRRNYPYLGKTDGLATHFRRLFGRDVYAGVELELNQAQLGSAKARNRIAGLVAESLAMALKLAA